ncbi:MAG: MFS transporter [Actinobacteria bacterium RBG_16_67_15]|nr:MAG: MFS transporter [Actinobacteria bacterium RBG_16_67_15]
MTSRTDAIWRMFSSLRVPNFRLFFAGQVISLSGTWMQGVAQAWLVLDLTGSGTKLGLVSSLQFLPVLLFGPLGGVLADRFDKRRVLYATQTAAAILAVILGVLVVTDVVRVWMVYLLAAGLGFVYVVDNPTRQTFIHEMVGAENLTNAVSLNSVLVNVARVIGPGLAGTLIVTVGLAPCFFINAASYAAVLIALFLMNPERLHREALVARRRGQLREGLRYVRSTPEVLVPLVMMAIVGTLAYEFQVVLPLLARFTFSGDAGTYGTMSVLMGLGAVIGGLATAAAGRRPATSLAWTAIVFGSIQVITSVAPNLLMTFVALLFLGGASIRFLALGNATLQLAASPEMRGRVMALWAVAFLGSTPIGGPLVGWIGEHIGPRVALGLGGVATLAAGALSYRALARIALRADGEVAIPAPKPAG